MVHKIVTGKYWVFIETFVIALLILVIGFFLGFYVEFSRVNSAVSDAKQFEIEALDLKLQNYYYQIMDKASCEQAVKQNFIFADEIYEKGLIIERYEQANQISDEIKNEKRKYVLLKTELWLNSILLKEKCGEVFHTVVYIYSDDQRDLARKATQSAISNVLYQIKQEKGNDIILLPIAGDLDLKVVDLQKRVYNVSYLPSLLIDEKYLIEGFADKDELENYLK